MQVITLSANPRVYLFIDRYRTTLAILSLSGKIPVVSDFNNCDEMPSNPQLVFGCILSIVFEIISSSIVSKQNLMCMFLIHVIFKRFIGRSV